MTVSWTPPVLTGEMVTLRAIRADDADPLRAGLTDPEGLRMAGLTKEYTPESVARWAADAATREGRFDWATTTDGEEILGRISLESVDLDARCGDIRSLTLPGHRGRGYGREAIMLVLDFAFGAPGDGGLGLHRVGLEVLSINPRAAALYQSLGFVVEGRRREVIGDGERFADAIGMGMLEDEYPAAKATWS
ncbi:GNAT family N-acetyltransferase [Ruania alba]|uniref:Protein N-acetyltransferase, RimJ/RimL family n=1 Tax=Ruania alba TaxID=648782 RepID=A0A1H5NJI5_9MICO|nr:GNAT family protein [Ruania alba]SEF01041.1 Protein N-acetyltransferase, RimJ/RimL family [Ruania alba]